jgi:hypothetical protein
LTAPAIWSFHPVKCIWCNFKTHKPKQELTVRGLCFDCEDEYIDTLVTPSFDNLKGLDIWSKTELPLR